MTSAVDQLSFGVGVGRQQRLVIVISVRIDDDSIVILFCTQSHVPMAVVCDVTVGDFYCGKKNNNTINILYLIITISNNIIYNIINVYSSPNRTARCNIIFNV